MVSWGPGAAIDSSLVDMGRRIPARVPLSAIFEVGVSTREGLSRQAPLRVVVNGHGE